MCWLCTKFGFRIDAYIYVEDNCKAFFVYLVTLGCYSILVVGDVFGFKLLEAEITYGVWRNVLHVRCAGEVVADMWQPGWGLGLMVRSLKIGCSGLDI